jgi:hypothetical protein
MVAKRRRGSKPASGNKPKSPSQRTRSDPGSAAPAKPDERVRADSGVFTRVLRQASRLPRGTIIAIIGSIATGLLGFFLGVAKNDANVYFNRADECYNSLSELNIDLAPLAQSLTIAHSLDAPIDVQNHAVDDINRYKRRSDTVGNKCPVEKDTQYLRRDAVAKYDQAIDALDKCLTPESTCTYDQIIPLMKTVRDAINPLMDQANGVQNWSVFKKASVSVLHFF